MDKLGLSASRGESCCVQHGIVAVCGLEKHFLKCQVVPEYVPCRLIWLVSSNEYIHIVTNVYNNL